MNYEVIGIFISKKRKEKNMTQKELASKIGVTDKAVSKWERGLGCPDVSILELLANALDVSILEILKGRKIENEVIPVTEMDDYVKETINYSNKTIRNKYEKIILNILTFIIIGICSFLFIININHIIYLNKTYEYNFENNMFNEINKNINMIDENIKIIKEKSNIFNKEDYIKLIQKIDNYFNKIKNVSILKYKGIQKFKLNDLNNLDSEIPSILEIVDGYRLLANYDSSMLEYKELLQLSYVSKIYSSQYLYNEPILSYQYKIISEDNNLYIDKIQARIYEFTYRINEFLYFTNNVIKVGEFHE